MSHKVDNIVTGFFSGFITGVLFIVFGGILCLTGIGALIGIPMIICGVISMFGGGAIVGFFFKNGECPYCGNDIVWLPYLVKGINCRACKKRVVFKNDLPQIVN